MRSLVMIVSIVTLSIGFLSSCVNNDDEVFAQVNAQMEEIATDGEGESGGQKPPPQ